MLACLARGNLLDILQEGFTEQQLQAYVAWVNSQLKKKPAVRPVQDLRQDLRDGVTLALLIEIVAGEKLSGIEANPSSQQEMRENVEKVLQFVASKKIRMHQTSAKDIVDGNLKSTMRLILALAAHFKPGSGRGGSPGSGGRSWAGAPGSLRPRSAAAVAQGAVAVLADVRQDVQHSGRDVFRHRQSPRSSSVDEEIENPYWSVRALVQQYEGQQNVPLESHPSSIPSPTPEPGIAEKGTARVTAGEGAVPGAGHSLGRARIPLESRKAAWEEPESLWNQGKLPGKSLNLSGIKESSLGRAHIPLEAGSAVWEEPTSLWKPGEQPGKSPHPSGSRESSLGRAHIPLEAGRAAWEEPAAPSPGGSSDAQQRREGGMG